MKLALGLALASASLLSIPAHADAPDPAPTLFTDAAIHATVVTGPHHLHKVALNLNVTDWWLSGAVTDGVVGDPQLIVDAHMVTWALLEKATDATGAPLKATVLKREPSPTFPKKVLERVAITLPRALADTARRDGLTVTVSGTKVVAGATRAFTITVPAQAMAAFLDGYAKAASTAAEPSAAVAPPPIAPPATPPAIVPQPVAPSPITPPAPSAPPPVKSPQPPSPPIATPAPPAPTPAPPKPAPQPAASPPAAPQIPSLPTPPLVSIPGSATMPTPMPDAADGAAPSAGESESQGGTGTWVPSLGLQFVPTSSGAMVLTNKAGSIAAAKGIDGGDFIESADGVSIKGLSEADMAAKIAGAKMLHLIAAGDVRVR